MAILEFLKQNEGIVLLLGLFSVCLTIILIKVQSQVK